MAALLDLPEETEKKSGRRTAVIIALYDFMLGDDIIAAIKRILELKAIPPSGENMEFLKKRVLK